jgi:hypothetical protein
MICQCGEILILFWWNDEKISYQCKRCRETFQLSHTTSESPRQMMFREEKGKSN